MCTTIDFCKVVPLRVAAQGRIYKIEKGKARAHLPARFLKMVTSVIILHKP